MSTLSNQPLFVVSSRISCIVFAMLPLLVVGRPAAADTIRVPQDQSRIQAAIDAAHPGDIILVAPGRYLERLRLKPGITLRSVGEDGPGRDGRKRAEVVVLDGGGADATAPGVVMAEDSTLDGFTVTRVGVFDELLWKKHYDSQGEELGDDEGAMQAEGSLPAVQVPGVACTICNCLVHDNGDVGIGVLGSKTTKTSARIVDNIVYRNLGGGIGIAEGAEPLVQRNTCRENLRAGIGCRRANPLILDNVCYQNVRAGIGCREGAQPVLRGNRCYQNRRAGIGIRMAGTAPLVESNTCEENDLAGIGCRDGASPILRGNTCRKNKMAGIGCRDGAQPVLIGNECRENEAAGIGIQAKSSAILHGNKCLENRLVAVGISEHSSATLIDNELVRTGGQPPLVAIRDNSTAHLLNNRLTGGGVAALLIQGTASVSRNTFTGRGGEQGNAIWVWENSQASIRDNAIDGYRSAINANKATVEVTANSVRNFRETAIVVKESRAPCHVYGNTAISAATEARVVDIQGPAGIVVENVLKKN